MISGGDLLGARRHPLAQHRLQFVHELGEERQVRPVPACAQPELVEQCVLGASVPFIRVPQVPGVGVLVVEVRGRVVVQCDVHLRRDPHGRKAASGV